MFPTCWPWPVPFSQHFRFNGPLGYLHKTREIQAHNNMTFYHEKEMKSPFSFAVFPASASCCPKFPLFTHFPPPPCLSISIVGPSHTNTPINTVCLTLLHRKAGESSDWSGLEPLFPVFHTNSDYFWETAALQWRSAVLGSLAWWLLLDTLHDGGGFPGVLHSSDHYQVSLKCSQQACGESCQVCNQLNVLISTHSLRFRFHTCLTAASFFIT